MRRSSASLRSLTRAEEIGADDRVQCKCTRDNAGWGGRLDRTAVRDLRLANPNAARVLDVEVGCERRRLNGITSSEDAIARIEQRLRGESPADRIAWPQAPWRM
jgi:hypothetical protein